MITARVVVDLPRDELVEHLGWYGREVEAVDATRCAWPLEADSVEVLASALMWLPPGARYRVEGSAELREFLAAQATRFAAASAAA